MQLILRHLISITIVSQLKTHIADNPMHYELSNDSRINFNKREIKQFTAPIIYIYVVR